jgi:hypothetical protein
MIDDMVLLKQAMEQMDAEDPTVAQAAKDRAAQTLSDAGLSFSKMADVIERRGLLLRPRILTGIKKMDQPGMLGDAAFRDTGGALRKEGQSFYQIADALERTGGPAAGYGNPLPAGYANPLPEGEPLRELPREPLYQMPRDPAPSAWLAALAFVARIIFFPLLHPIRFLAIALLLIFLFYALRGFVGLGQGASGIFSYGADRVVASLSSFVHDTILRRSSGTTDAPPRPPVPIPSPSVATAAPSPSPSPSAIPDNAQAPPATPPNPSAHASAPPASAPPALAPPASLPHAPPSAFSAPRSTAPAGPPVSTPRRTGRGEFPSRWAADCDPESDDHDPWSPRRELESNRARSLEDMVPEAAPRNSRVAGRCFGGVGGCYWGGN